MAESFRTCLDGHRCENESRCMENPNDEGSFYCDCSVANGDFAGLYCEYGAEEYCKFPQEASETWFCSNGGTCVLDVQQNGAKYYCDCNDDAYEGPHCEFVKGALPDDWPGENGAMGLSSGKQKDGLKTGVVILIVLVAMTIVGLVFKMVVQKRLREEGPTTAPKNAIKDQSQALQLEADGQIFRDAVKSSTTPAPETDDYFFESPDGVLVEANELPKTHSFESSDSGGHAHII